MWKHKCRVFHPLQWKFWSMACFQLGLEATKSILNPCSKFCVMFWVHIIIPSDGLEYFNLFRVKCEIGFYFYLFLNFWLILKTQKDFLFVCVQFLLFCLFNWSTLHLPPFCCLFLFFVWYIIICLGFGIYQKHPLYFIWGRGIDCVYFTLSKLHLVGIHRYVAIVVVHFTHPLAFIFIFFRGSFLRHLSFINFTSKFNFFGHY